MTSSQHKEYLKNSKKYLIWVIENNDNLDAGTKKELIKQIRLALNSDFTNDTLKMLTTKGDAGNENQTF